MAIIINGKTYRNLQEQVQKNMEDIEEIKESPLIDAYSKAQSDAKFLAKANLTDYSINDIIVADSEIQSGEVELRAVSAQDVKSEVSLDPTSAIIKTTSGTNNSTIGVSGTEIDITTSTLKYNSNEVLSIGTDDNLNKTLIRVSQIAARDGEETDNKGRIYLNSGIRAGSVQLQASGEESGASIYVRGTSAVGSEGLIEINGETQFNTENRIKVYDGSSTTKQIAYLSDITGASASTYNLALGTRNSNLWFATITAEPGLENTYIGFDAIDFINKYARYISWYYENSNDTSGDNHKMCTFTIPGQGLNFYLADGTIKATVIPPTAAVLTVTKTN